MIGATPATVVHAFLDRVENNPYGFAARVIEKGREEFTLTYLQLYRLMAEMAAGLAERGIAAGDRVILALPGSRHLLAGYLAALSGGIVPLIVAEAKPGRSGLYAANLGEFVRAMEARCVVVPDAQAAELASLLPVPVVGAEALRRPATELAGPVAASPEGIAHLQATSGSTGRPKLAVVRHRNIVANVRAIGSAVGQRPDDILVTWLPPSHDMGLIGISYSLLWQIPIVLSDTANFVQNPLLWPQWISRYAGTLSPAPNSAFQMCARLARLRPPKGLSLSSWRVALCGAEPVHESTLRQFQAAYAGAGLKDTTLVPVYGLAEATLAVTIPAGSAPFRADHVRSEALGAERRAEPAAAGASGSLAMVCLGPVIPGHQLRIVDAEGRPLPDRQVGEVEFAGPSVVDGYWENPEATAALRRPDGFLRTGDLGYLVGGELYVTGRHKDLLIINGRNYTPNQIEAFVENLTDSAVTPAAVAVGIADRELNTEQLHLLLDTRLAAGDEQRAVEDRIRHGLEEVFGLGGVMVHWVTSGQIPRTSSGKVQRYLCRQLIEEAARATSPPRANGMANRVTA